MSNEAEENADREAEIRKSMTDAAAERESEDELDRQTSRGQSSNGEDRSDLPSMHEVTDNSSGYRKRMAGQIQGSMHEVTENSSAYRKRKAKEWQDANPNFKMEGEKQADAAAMIKEMADVKKTADEAIFWLNMLMEEGAGKKNQDRWHDEIEYDAFLCTWVEDSTSAIAVADGKCYLDDSETSLSSIPDVPTTETGVIYIKLTISTATWVNPAFATTAAYAALVPTSDIKYFALSDVTWDADGVEEIKPRHRGDIRYTSTGPVAFTVSKKYFESSTAKLDIVNGVVFWGDAAREITPFTYPATTTLALIHGVNHVYVDMTWAGAGTVTLARMSGSIPTPSASSYKHWLGSWTVDVGAGTIIKTFTAWPGGNIHIPAAYDG